jgi:hypothetical protein
MRVALRNALLVCLTTLLAFLTLGGPSPQAPAAQVPASHTHGRVLVLLLCKSASQLTLARLESLTAAGIDAHALPDEPPTAPHARVHWQPTAAVVSAGYLFLNPKMAANTSTWDRALLHAATAAAGRMTWFVEEDVWFPSAADFALVLDAYGGRQEDLVASDVLSRGPDEEDVWYWFQKGHVLGVPGLDGQAMLPRYPGAPALGTLNVLCRLSPRVLAEVAAMARQHRRLILHEALLPSIVAARWREGWALTWLAHPWSNIRWRPVVPLALARAGVASQGWRVVHPVKLNADSAVEEDAVLEEEEEQ